MLMLLSVNFLSYGIVQITGSKKVKCLTPIHKLNKAGYLTFI